MVVWVTDIDPPRESFGLGALVPPLVSNGRRNRIWREDFALSLALAAHDDLLLWCLEFGQDGWRKEEGRLVRRLGTGWSSESEGPSERRGESQSDGTDLESRQRVRDRSTKMWATDVRGTYSQMLDQSPDEKPGLLTLCTDEHLLNDLQLKRTSVHIKCRSRGRRYSRHSSSFALPCPSS